MVYSSSDACDVAEDATEARAMCFSERGEDATARAVLSDTGDVEGDPVHRFGEVEGEVFGVKNLSSSISGAGGSGS